jgi:osmoprotectant transport system permease protein
VSGAVGQAQSSGVWQQTWDFFTDGTHWSGPNGIPTKLGEHVSVSAYALLLALALAIPVGLYCGHARRLGFLAINVAGLGRAVPSLAILGLAEQAFGIGFTPTFLALFALALPPLVTNTYVGVTEVDREVVEAARGSGLSGRQLLWRVELPLAAPLILSGVRTAAVQVVATATLGSVVAFGGLGFYIISGLPSGNYGEVVAGAVLVALLALLTEGLFALLQRVVTPVHLRRSRRTRVTRAAPGEVFATGPAPAL